MIRESLNAVGVWFEQWYTHKSLQDDAGSDAVLDIYRDDIQRLMAEEGYQSFDIVSCQAFTDKQQFRKKFLVEHIHTDDEVLFFVAGHGVFFLHPVTSLKGFYLTGSDMMTAGVGGAMLGLRAGKVARLLKNG